MFLAAGNLGVGGYQSWFFKKVACPMLAVWECWKNGRDKEKCLELSRSIRLLDWAVMTHDWIARREE